MKRSLALGFAGALATAVDGAALASPGVGLTVRPLFGPDAATGEGWLEVAARVDNASSAAISGTLRISVDRAGDGRRFVASAPFAAPAHATVTVQLPVALEGGIPSLVCEVDASDGARLAETTLSLPAGDSPLLVDADVPSRLGAVMRGWPMTLPWSPTGGSYPRSPAPLTVSALETQPATGDLVLPDRPAGWAPATAAIFPSDVLASLRGPRLGALLGWVLAGGTLAVIPRRPEDLRVGVLTTLAGGVVTPAPAPPVMFTLPSATRPSEDDPLHPSPAPGGADPAPGTTPIAWFVPARTSAVAPGGGGPSPALAAKLVGFRGGNLRPSALGASAPYGLGQVHVLGFDPTAPAALADGWAHARVLDLVEQAWERRALVAFPDGSGMGRTSNLSPVRRLLDPNESFRPALAVASVLLVVYSILVGPLLFLRARRRRRPLAPLVWVPTASAVAFALVVLVGRVAKGWRGRARHLALVEAGAGMSRGASRAFRSFFSSETGSMRVRALEPAAVLDVLSSDAHDLQEASLRVEDDGTSLENLTTLPWQTVVVCDEALAALGAGVAVRQTTTGDVLVVNRSGHALRDVLVWAPRTGGRWIDRIEDGGRAAASSGRELFTATARSTSTAGTRTVHALDTTVLAALPGGAARAAAAWSALAAASSSSVDWWPDDVPVVLAEADDGSGATLDTGLRVESDRLLVRILGEGGPE